MTATTRSEDTARSTWWLGSILGWLALFLAVGALLLTVLVPALVGGSRYTILTGSMRPTYPPGTLVVVEPAAVGELGVGAPITYQLESGKPDVVTHRIVSVRHTPAGQTTFVTQGDANAVSDPTPVLPEQIRGKVWYSVPYLGYVNNWLTGDRRAGVIAIVIVGLGGYAVYNIFADVRDRRRGKGAS